MSGFGISYDWDPSLVLVSALFREVADSVEEMREPLEEMREYAATIMPRNIENQGDGSWPGLTEGTWERKDGGSILIESGDLLASVGGTHWWDINGEELVLHQPTDPYYAPVHTTGSVWMPAREYAYFMPQDVDAVERIAWEWLDKVTAPL